MLATSHFVVTTGILLAAKRLGLVVSYQIIIWTYVFGNLIDLDHILLYPRESLKATLKFLSSRGESVFGKNPLFKDKSFHSYVQEPWFAVAVWCVTLVIYISVQRIEILLPVVALTLHLAMDASMNFKKKLFWPAASSPI